ncbi:MULTISPECIES: peptidoglycan DD-metalloendopeptidase family protein [Nocardia]|uniref:peptidoglycan DD-metalloendopeptidase family protein n=1 Tax=Nocardia TaxID=1817 RepID=UPI002458492C|nr:MULTISPECIES: peptidoglycan DD-metalloendopeptidase family protein [Nocardia]
MSSAGAAAAVGGVGMVTLTAVMLVMFADADRSSTSCLPGNSSPAPVLAGAVVASSAADPAGLGTAPGNASERVMPMAEGTYTLASGFGPRWGEMHKGVDFAAEIGTPIYAAADGVVVAAGPASGFGNWIVIDSIDDQRQPFSTVYGHMRDDGVGVQVRQQVSAGQQIGTVGDAGQSTGPHLHFEVVPGGRFTGGTQIDPMPWLAGAATRSGTGRPQEAGQAPVPNCPPGFGTQGGQLADGTVPAELDQWYRRAGSLCPQITASLLAAQGRQESGFRRGLTSPAGAEGLAQFLPGTAASLAPDGQPYVIDADGNGTASVWDDGDAIVGQGRYMCALASRIEEWKRQGTVSGDTATLALAAYNAGEGAVLKYGGVPPYGETQNYVRVIVEAEPQFRSAGASGRFVPAPGSPLGDQTVAAARQYLGTPYVWGGGGPSGPSGGGFDCSGFTSYAIHAASHGTVTLPRTSEQQWSVGVEIPLEEAQPGDLVFGNWGEAGPGHVGIVVGPGRMIHAPQSGESVTEADFQRGMRARRVM